MSNLLREFGRFLSKDSAKFELHISSRILDVCYLQLHLFEQQKFLLDKPSDLSVFPKVLWLSNILF